MPHRNQATSHSFECRQCGIVAYGPDWRKVLDEAEQHVRLFHQEVDGEKTIDAAA